MSGSPDSSEPVRHVSNVSKLRELSSGCSGCSGCITHHRTVMSSCRSCPGQAVVKPMQLSGSSPVRTPPYFSGPRTRKWKRKLQLRRRFLRTSSWCPASSLWSWKCWTLGPWRCSACREEPGRHKAAFRFLSDSAGCLACQPAARFVGRRMISWRLYKVVLWHRDRTDKPLDRILPAAAWLWSWGAEFPVTDPLCHDMTLDSFLSMNFNQQNQKIALFWSFDWIEFSTSYSFEIYIFSKFKHDEDHVELLRWNVIRNTSRDWPGTVRTELWISALANWDIFLNVRPPPSNNIFPPAHIIRDQVIIGITGGTQEAITCKWGPSLVTSVISALVTVMRCSDDDNDDEWWWSLSSLLIQTQTHTIVRGEMMHQVQPSALLEPTKGR